ncbi:MAG: transcription elongation factor subunit Spt4 [Candidatus Woesearchaeota archaeon]
MKKKVCKKCKIFVDGETCPVCKRNAFSTNWQGRIYFMDVANSTIAKNINVDLKGEYAIKVK